MDTDFQMPARDAFVEIPSLRGLRLARVGQADGKTLDVIEAVKDVIIPALTHPGSEKGRVLSGSLRFFQDGESRVLSAGDTWEVAGGTPQGPHIVLENDTRVLILRDGESALG